MLLTSCPENDPPSDDALIDDAEWESNTMSTFTNNNGNDSAEVATVGKDRQDE